MFRSIVHIWKQFLRSYKKVASLRFLILGVLVGVVSGLAALGFFSGIEYLKHLFLSSWAGLQLPAPAGESLFHGHTPGAHRPWIVPILTTSVGLLTGLVVQRFIPKAVESGTDGTDAMIKCFHHENGVMRPLVWCIRGVTSILTIAAGGSAGREGPISQIGAGVGAFLADRFKLSTRERRILLLAGAAGGLGAIFRAPLGGALTAIEVIYREDFETEAILPAVVSSVVSYSIFTFVFGSEPILGIPDFSFTSVRELPFYVMLAVVCAATGWFYVRSFHFLKYNFFARMRAKVGIAWTMTAGGLGMGLLGMAFPQVLTGGYGWLEMAVWGQLSVPVMLAILLGKTLATSLTIGSGMSGGMFAPSLFMGGLSGGVVGFLAHERFPDIVTQPGGYVLVGMAAMFAGVAKAPVGPLIMVCELTQGYGLLAPLMLASVICLALNRNVLLYENQVDNKFESPAHREDTTINLLEQLQVRDFFRPGVVTTLEEGTTLRALTDIIAGTNEFTFPVRGEEGKLSGILAIQDVRNVLFDEDLFELVLVKELARKPVTLHLGDDLYKALLLFVDNDLSQIPVSDGDGDIIGMLNREDVFKAYSRTLQEARED